MVIVKPGNVDPTLRGECPECGCVFDCYMSETRRGMATAADRNAARWALCPTQECTAVVRVYPKPERPEAVG